MNNGERPKQIYKNYCNSLSKNVLVILTLSYSITYKQYKLTYIALLNYIILYEDSIVLYM